MRKYINAKYTLIPEKFTTDKDKAYPVTIDEFKKNNILPDEYLNNFIEQEDTTDKKKT